MDSLEGNGMFIQRSVKQSGLGSTVLKSSTGMVVSMYRDFEIISSIRTSAENKSDDNLWFIRELIYIYKQMELKATFKSVKRVDVIKEDHHL